MSGEPWYNISCGGAWGVHFGRLYPVRSGVDDEVWGPNDMDGFDEFDPGQVCRLRQERETAESSSRKAEVATPPGSAPTALWGTPPSSPPRHRRLPTTRSREDFGYSTCQPVIGLVTRCASHLTFITPKRTKRSIRGPPDLDLLKKWCMWTAMVS